MQHISARCVPRDGRVSITAVARALRATRLIWNRRVISVRFSNAAVMWREKNFRANKKGPWWTRLARLKKQCRFIFARYLIVRLPLSRRSA